MTLIVETGQAGTDSESYASVAQADLYFANRGTAEWAALTTPAKEQALRRATDYMEWVYRTRWVGCRSTLTQVLSWPRSVVPVPDAPFGYHGFPSFLPLNVVPVQVVNACCELAMRAVVGDLAPDLERQTSSESVGSVSVSYQAGAVQYVRFRAVDLMLRVYLGDGAVRMVRS